MNEYYVIIIMQIKFCNSSLVEERTTYFPASELMSMEGTGLALLRGR